MSNAREALERAITNLINDCRDGVGWPPEWLIETHEPKLRAALASPPEGAGRGAEPVEPREVLLFASYCGNDNPNCSEEKPCPCCLGMSNVFRVDFAGSTYLRELAPEWNDPKQAASALPDATPIPSETRGLREALEQAREEFIGQKFLTNNYCELCDAHAPKTHDANGFVAGKIKHGPDCTIGKIEQALATPTQPQPDSDGLREAAEIAKTLDDVARAQEINNILLLLKVKHNWLTSYEVGFSYQDIEIIAAALRCAAGDAEAHAEISQARQDLVQVLFHEKSAAHFTKHGDGNDR